MVMNHQFQVQFIINCITGNHLILRIRIKLKFYQVNANFKKPVLADQCIAENPDNFIAMIFKGSKSNVTQDFAFVYLQNCEKAKKFISKFRKFTQNIQKHKIQHCAYHLQGKMKEFKVKLFKIQTNLMIFINSYKKVFVKFDDFQNLKEAKKMWIAVALKHFKIELDYIEQYTKEILKNQVVYAQILFVNNKIANYILVYEHILKQNPQNLLAFVGIIQLQISTSEINKFQRQALSINKHVFDENIQKGMYQQNKKYLFKKWNKLQKQKVLWHHFNLKALKFATNIIHLKIVFDDEQIYSFNFDCFSIWKQFPLNISHFYKKNGLRFNMKLSFSHHCVNLYSLDFQKFLPQINIIL